MGREGAGRVEACDRENLSQRRKHVMAPRGRRRHSLGRRKEDMYRSPSALSEEARQQIADTLNARLADGLDLHSQIKVAHWNIKGPQFPSLHPAVRDLRHRPGPVQRRPRRAGGHPGRPGLRHEPARGPTIAPGRVSPGDDPRPGACPPAGRTLRHLPGACGSPGRRSSGSPTQTPSISLTQVATSFEKHAWFLRASLEA